jgi:heat shock protein HtpX
MSGPGLRTGLLLGLFALPMAMIGGWAGGVAGLLVAGIVALVVGGATIRYGGRVLALRAVRARPVLVAEAPMLHAMVGDLASRRGIPAPAVHLSPTLAMNAFVTGPDPVLCVTEGLLARLDERELRAVLAREISRIGTGVRVATGRSAGYRADADAALLTGDPRGLARALRTLEAGAAALPLPGGARLAVAGSLMIVNPQPGRRVARFLSPQPPVADRVARLEELVAVQVAPVQMTVVPSLSVPVSRAEAGDDRLATSGQPL